ncbi:hypothetical protein DV872_23590 [Oceanispirochaeta sp. M1]|nr:hypothetical protein DV872_23590 [Oceanispirochaeta sp. M1]
MSIWNIFSLFGGLAIFLFGMMEMNKHLTDHTVHHLVGVDGIRHLDSLLNILSTLTNNRCNFLIMHN